MSADARGWANSPCRTHGRFGRVTEAPGLLGPVFAFTPTLFPPAVTVAPALVPPAVTVAPALVPPAVTVAPTPDSLVVTVTGPPAPTLTPPPPPPLVPPLAPPVAPPLGGGRLGGGCWYGDGFAGSSTVGGLPVDPRTGDEPRTVVGADLGTVA
jgi:hypothetical protein